MSSLVSVLPATLLAVLLLDFDGRWRQTLHQRAPPAAAKTCFRPYKVHHVDSDPASAKQETCFCNAKPGAASDDATRYTRIHSGQAAT